jgi:hypothetical protein
MLIRRARKQFTDFTVGHFLAVFIQQANVAAAWPFASYGAELVKMREKQGN